MNVDTVAVVTCSFQDTPQDSKDNNVLAHIKNDIIVCGKNIFGNDNYFT